ncbi:hypothetical protein [Gloeobacter violaceus]|nr:hypothetical protein [Gloeobacter violaceus]
MIQPRHCPLCTRLLRSVAVIEDGLLHCEWDGTFHWDGQARRLRNLKSQQIWHLDVAGRVINPTRVQAVPEPRLHRRPIYLPKLP